MELNINQEENQENTRKLIDLICARYQPAINAEDADEMLTTIDLIEQISDFADTTKDIVFNAMKAAGFNIHYTGAGFVWLLKAI